MVVDEPLTPLLGWKAAEQLQLITANYDNLVQIYATQEFTESTCNLTIQQYLMVFWVHCQE